MGEATRRGSDAEENGMVSDRKHEEKRKRRKRRRKQNKNEEGGGKGKRVQSRKEREKREAQNEERNHRKNTEDEESEVVSFLSYLTGTFTRVLSVIARRFTMLFLICVMMLSALEIPRANSFLRLS